LTEVFRSCRAIGKIKEEGGYVMNTIVRLMLVFMLMIVAAPAYSGEAIQMWKCEMDDDTSEEEVKAMAREWLTAAKKIKGGERLEAYVYFPVAVNAIGEADVWFVVVAPSFEEWGKFWDNYPNSQAAEMEERHNEKIVCPDSALWESIKVE
jgi:hypothetical protein